MTYSEMPTGKCFVSGKENCPIYIIGNLIEMPLSEVSYAKFILKLEKDKTYQARKKKMNEIADRLRKSTKKWETLSARIRTNEDIPGLAQEQLEYCDLELEARRMNYDRTVNFVRILEELRAEEQSDED